MQKQLSYRIRADLFAQLAQLEIAGLPTNRAFALLNLPPRVQPRMELMRSLIKKSGDIAGAGERSGVFTRLESRLIRAATNAGSPANMYRRLGDYYTDRAMQFQSMKSKMALPAFMFIAALLIQPLPALVGGQITTVEYVWGVLKPVLIIVAAYFAFKFFAQREIHTRGKSIYQSIPLYGPVFVRRNVRDFFESLALMLEAGISMLDALPAALDTIEDGDIKRNFAKIRQRIEQGQPLHVALQGIGYINNQDVIQFVKTGEASGTLPEMLMRHTKFETAAINSWFEQFATWMPRVVYGMVVIWMAYGLLTSGGFTPKMPAGL